MVKITSENVSWKFNGLSTDINVTHINHTVNLLKLIIIDDKWRNRAN